MTKPAVWVQITVKKYRVDDKNLLHLKYPTCQRLCMFFLSVLMKISFQKWFCLILQILMTLKEKNLEKYGSWFSSLLIRKMSQELIVGSQVPLSLQQFSLTKEILKMFYNLEGIQWRPWRRFDQFYEVFSPDNLKKKKKGKKNQKRWIHGSILLIWSCCFSETRKNFTFYVTAVTDFVYLMFSRIFL